MKKILALIMALAMVLCLAACGGNGGDDETTTAPAGETSANAEADGTEAAPVDGTEAATGEDATATSEEASSEEASTDAEGNTEAATQTGAQTGAALSKAEFVALLNADTAKIAKSGSYKVNRSSAYIRPLQCDGEKILNGIISLIDKNSNVGTVVGGFLGIGDKATNVAKGKAADEKFDSDYLLKGTALKESDLASFSESNGVYTFTLPAASNPQKNNTTPLARFTNDFFTHKEVSDGITKEVGDKVVLDKSNVDYTKITVTVTVKDGKISTISFSYNFEAQLTLKAAGIGIDGNGAAKTTNTYSNIKY